MNKTQRLWRWLGLIFVLSFGALGYLGWQIHLQAPPIPTAVSTPDGDVLFTGEEVQLGQQVWLASGGQQQGSVWGHGAYVAPDWSADWLHREAVALGETHSKLRFKAPAAAAPEDRAAIASLVRSEMRRNTYDEATGRVIVSPARAQAIREVATHYSGVFGDAPAFNELREQYAMTNGTVPDATDRKALTAFFFWTSWAAATTRKLRRRRPTRSRACALRHP